MATRTIANGGGNYNSTGTWVEGAVPTAADDVVATGTSGNLTVTANAVCRSLDLNGYTGVFTRDIGTTFKIGDGTAGAGNIAMRLAGTITDNSAGQFEFVSTSTTQQTITSNGKTIGGIRFNGAGGSWILTDALTTSITTSAVQVSQGAFDTGNQAISTKSWNQSTTTTRSVTLGTSTITLTGTSGGVWNGTTTTNLTFSGASSTIVFSGTGNGFQGGGLTYGTLTIDTTISGSVTISGSNTFTKIGVTGATAKTLIFTLGTTQTLTGGSDAFPSGASGAKLTCQSTGAGSAWTLSKSSGSVSCNYISLKDSTASGGATFTAGPQAIDVSGNTGWTFTSVAFDAASNVGSFQTGVSTYNWNHTCTGSNLGLAVDIIMLSAGQTVSGVTYNGVAMSLVTNAATNIPTSSPVGRIESWWLDAPASGTHSVAVTLSAASTSVGLAVSYTNCVQSGATEAGNAAQGTTANGSVTITTATDYARVHSAFGTTDTTATVGAGLTSRNLVSGALVGRGIDADTLVISPAEATVAQWVSGSLIPWGATGYGIKPFVAAAIVPGGEYYRRFLAGAE